jgi:hypothetical protein
MRSFTILTPHHIWIRISNLGRSGGGKYETHRRVEKYIETSGRVN